MSRRRILITGSTGFIGRHLVRKLVRISDLQLICIVREGERHPQAGSLTNQGAIVVPGNFFNEAVLRRVFDQHKIQQVVHVAAIRGGGNASAAEFQEVNVKGTELLLREAYEHRIEKFIFCSSVGVYGTIPAVVPAGFETSLHGDNRYHQSKIAGEQAVEGYIKKGLNAYIVRPAITYGRGDDGFPQTLVHLVRRRLLLLPRTNHQIHLVDVEKVGDVFLNLVLKDQRAPRIFIAADAETLSLKDLVDSIHEHFYGRPYPAYLRLPDWSFSLAFRLFERIGSEKWAARIALLSHDWAYQCAETDRTLGIQAVPTGEAFSLFLRDNFPEGSAHGRGHDNNNYK